LSFAARSLSATERFLRGIRRNLAALAVVLALLLVALWMYTNNRIGMYPIASMAIGGLVGLVELAGRYRHAPMRAALSWSGVFYILVNVAASGAAYFFLVAFSVTTVHMVVSYIESREHVLQELKVLGPKLHMRSTYSFPSTSQTRAPSPRA